MCGRFTLLAPLEEIAAFFQAEPCEGFPGPRYNIAPSRPVATVRNRPARALEMMNWGFVPRWSGRAGANRPLINARAETLEEKASFSGAFRTRRCLVPADGFYEWRKAGRLARPHHFQVEDGSLFAMAGLFEEPRDEVEAEGSGEVGSVRSVVIVTCAANALMSPIHARMPVILARESWKVWLDEETTARDLKALLVPYPHGLMTQREVSTVVNDARAEGPTCLGGPELDQPKLF